MKKLLVIILALFSLHSFAQDTTYVKVRGIPGAYNFSKSGDSLIFYVSGVRNALSVGSTVDLTPFLRKSDTANMLANYATKNLIPTNNNQLTNGAGFITSAAIAGKVNVSDTASMLNKYLRKTDTTGKWISPAVANATYATIANLNLKANDNAVMHNTGDEIIYGRKTLSDSLTLGTTTDGIINVKKGAGLIINSYQSASFRLLPYLGDIWFQNTFLNGNINFSGQSGATLTGNVKFFISGYGLLGADTISTRSNVRSTYATIANLALKQNVIFDTSSSNTNDYIITSPTAGVIQNVIRPLAAEGAGAAVSLSTGTFGRSYATRTKLWDNGILGIVRTTGSTINYQYFGAGSDATYNNNNLRLYPDKTVGLMTVNDAAGDFVTRNLSTGLITRRTATEALSDMGGISSATAASTYATNTALNSKLNISDTANKWLPKTFTQNLYYEYPIVPKNDTTAEMAQGWKDTVAYKVDVATKANPVFTGTAKINSDTLATKADVRSGVASIPSGISDFMFLLNRDYANDSLAIADGGLNIGDLYQSSGAVKVVTRSEFSYTIDNTDGSANAYQLRMDANTGNVKGTIYWGDGKDTVLTPDIYHEVSHTYAAGSSYTVKIVTFPEDNLNKLYLNNNGSNNIKITSIKNIKSLTRLNVFQAERANISIVDTLSFPSTVSFLSFADDPITTFNNLSNLQLTNLVLNGTQIQPNDIMLPPTITYLAMNAMQHVGGGSTWNATDVNNFLVRLDAMTFNAGAKTLDFTQYNSATPSGAGLTAKTSLESKGWTITTD